MIARIVLYKLKDEYSNVSSRAEIAERTRAALGALQNVRAVSVGVPADAVSEASWDISIVVQFDTMDELQEYMTDPAHRAYFDEYASPRIEVRKAWNFHT